MKGALLALLLELDEPAHPWKLATLLERRLGPASGIDPEAVYKMLPVLARDDLVACTTRENETGNYREQKVYGPTEFTEGAVDIWIATPISEDAGRTELQIKIAFSRPADAIVLLALLDSYEKRCIERVLECLEVDVPMSSWRGVAMNAACSWTKEHLEAEERWIMQTRESIRAFQRHSATY